MGKLIVYPRWQSTQLLVFDASRPHDIFSWLVPEGMRAEWNFELVPTWYFVPGAKWLPTASGGLVQHFERPGRGSIRTEITPGDARLDVLMTVRNLGAHPIRHAVGHVCWDWRQARHFNAQALDRTYIEAGGDLTPICETDRSASLDRLMPVYPVRGADGPPHWRERAANGYGWGLSTMEASSAFIGLESIDGAWASGTIFRNAYSLSFNAKPEWHGCIHSEPYLGRIDPGQEAVAEGAVYLVQGTIHDLYARVKEEIS